uniref:Uncharacterized protein n=1 Tax=Ditylenchus dipsaci TaxID=166011 RepID=A0A915E7L2_9BILA
MIEMLNFYLILISLIVGIFHLDGCWGGDVNRTDPQFTSMRCREHCRRLLERSLERIGYSSQKISKEYSHTRLLMSSAKSFSNSKYYKDICWKYFDFGDCNKKCENSFSTLKARRKRQKSEEEKFFVKSTKLLIKSCKSAMDNELLANFRCIHKYHTFLEVQKIVTDIRKLAETYYYKEALIDFIFSTPPANTLRPRKIFSSDEDLEDTPPNFYYSSAKYEKDFVTYATTRRYNNWDPSFTGSLEQDETENHQPSVSLLQPSTVPVRTSPFPSDHHHRNPVTVTFPDQMPTKPVPLSDNLVVETTSIDDQPPNIHLQTKPPSKQEEEYSSKYSIASTKADSHLESTTIQSVEEQRLEPSSVIIDVYTGNPVDYYYSSSTEDMDDYVIDSSTTQSYSTETTSQEQESTTNGPSSDLFPIVFPVIGEKESGSSSMQTTKYSVTPDQRSTSVDNNQHNAKPNVWVTSTTTEQDLLKPTPLFTDSKIHVKKIVSFDESIDEQDMKGTNKQDFTQQNGLAHIDSGVKGEDYYEEGEEEEDVGSYHEEDEDYVSPYTIVTAHPDDFMVTGKNLVGEDSAESYAKEDQGDHEVDYIPVEPVKPYYANTLFVLFAIYSSFFIVAVASLACLLLAYVMRNRRDRLKASWIFFDDDHERF